MRSFIIHRSERTDRQTMVNDLIRAYGSVVVEAQMGFEAEKDSKAIRGCALSHLSILERVMPQLDVCLVFEDDTLPCPAEKNPSGIIIPDDCGAVLVGGWADRAVFHSPGFYNVIGPFRGTHAVIYNLKVLKKTPFLFNAYKQLACLKCASNDGVIFESILLNALHQSGLKLLRLDDMPFKSNNINSDRGIQGEDLEEKEFIR